MHVDVCDVAVAVLVVVTVMVVIMRCKCVVVVVVVVHGQCCGCLVCVLWRLCVHCYVSNVNVLLLRHF